eukprot:9467234-Pyramimonas_sp.AAC.1
MWKEKWVMRSRLCGRGFLGNQKWAADRHSSTAARASQRMMASICQCEPDFELESWDISSAFLQGLRFKELAERSKELGLDVRQEREVYIAPPANVWRHLKKLSKEFAAIPDDQIHLYVLQCAKPVPGLIDAPLLWQAALTLHIKDNMSGKRTLLDENCLVWHHAQTDKLQFATTVHVDDSFPTGKKDWLDWAHALLEKKFGKITRKTTPFTHLGIEYTRALNDAIPLSQGAYLDAIESPSTDKDRAKDDNLQCTPEEQHRFRFLCCQQLHLLQTRWDASA